MKFVAIPARLRGAALAGKLEDADLRVPLRDQVVAVEVAGAGDHARKLIVKLEVDHARAARRDRFGEVEARHGPIGLGPAVRMHERPADRLAVLLDLLQLDPAVLALLRLHVAAEAAVAAVLGREGAARAFEGVQVEVHVEPRDRYGAAIAPDEARLAFQRVIVRIED